MTTARFVALVRALPVILLLSAAPMVAQSSAAAYPSVRSYRTVTVAKGVYAFIAPEERTGFQSGNSIAVVGDSAVLIFDTGAMPSVTRAQIAELRKLTDKPVRWVVNSHWHPDHHLGNHEYQVAYPGVRFVGTPETQQGITDRARGFVDEVKSFGPTDSVMRLRLATGKRRDGSPLPAETRMRFELDTRDYAEFLPEISAAVPVASDQLVTGSLTIQLGGRTVKVIHAGRGNTAGDAIAVIPDVRVLLTGDLLTFPCPFPSTSYFNDWIPLLDRLKAMDARLIVPGHGEVQTDYGFLDQTRALLAYTRDRAADAVKRGLTLEQFTKEVSFAQFEPVFAGTDVIRNASFGGFYVEAAVPRAYLEATLAVKGERPPPYPAPER